MLEQIAFGIKKIVFPVSRGVAFIGLTVLVLMTLLTIADIVGRRLFGAPIRGTHEIIELAYAVVTFTALAYCATKDGHIEIDILVNRFPKLIQKIVGGVVLLATTGVLGLLSWRLIMQGMNLQHMRQESVSLAIPIYPFVYLAALGSVLITLVYLVRLLQTLSPHKGG